MADHNSVHDCFVSDNHKQELIILDEIVLKQHGSYRQVRRYVKGKHPRLGLIMIGWSGGWETVWEVDVIRPMAVFTVVEHQST